MQHILILVNALHQANMKISTKKSHFFQGSVEYLGHIMKDNKITVDPTKIQTIKNYPIPSDLKKIIATLRLSELLSGGISKNQCAKVQAILRSEQFCPKIETPYHLHMYI